MSDLLDAIRKIMSPLKQRVMLMISRGVVGTVDDSKKLQSVQILALAGEILADLERFQQFGFTAVPIPGSEAILLFPSGDREHGLVVAIDDRNLRPTGLTAGQSCMYDAVGSKFTLTNDGKSKIEATIKHEILAAQVDIGSGSVKEKVLNGETFQTTYNAHTHSVFGVLSTPPSTPSLPTDLSQAVKAATLMV